MSFEEVEIRCRLRRKLKRVGCCIGQVRIAAVSLETGVVSHGQMLLLFRGENYSGAVGMVIVKLAYLCE